MSEPLALARFDRLPAGYVHPDRLPGLLPAFAPATRRRIAACRRLRRPFSAAIARRFGLSDGAAEALRAAPSARLALMDRDALMGVARLAGAVWHGRSLRSVILAAPLGEVIGAIGAEAHAFALTHAELAPADVPPLSVRAVVDAIERDGFLCLGAWARGLPPAAGGRLRLKLAPATGVDGPTPALHAAHGPAIVERAAAGTLDRVA